MLTRQWIRLLVAILPLTANAQEGNTPADMEGMFYCNSQYNFEKIWIVNSETFVGWYINRGENLLISLTMENRLPLDTIVLGRNAVDFLQTISFSSDTSFQVLTLNNHFDVVLSGSKFKSIQKTPTLNNDRNHLVFKMKQGGISFNINSLSKDQAKYIVTFDSTDAKEISLNKVKKKNKGPIERAILTTVFHDATNELTILPSRDYSQIALIDWHNRAIDYLKLPELSDSKKEAYRFFFDHIASELYLMHYKEKAVNDFYLVDIREKKLVSAFQSDVFPNAILNGQIFYSKELKDDLSKLNSYCHYATPIDSELPKIMYLDEVLINN